ncbi:MAG TPA: glycine cleavage system aminomethyltransferase GcvT [Actinobacteria bacterium]|nr:glycine cleavage system aminomethyltransferase GcvT [Actinomycetota bacterium]
MAATEQTALHAEHVALGGRMVDFGGWDLPQQYSSIREEHLAVRTVAGVFDLSHMGRLDVRGRGAADYLQGVLTNDVTQVAPGRAQYTLLCREDGGILDDLVIYRRGEDDFLVVVNAANRVKDVAWLRDHLPSGVTLDDRTYDVSLIALQGPRAESLLPASGLDPASLPYFGFGQGEIDGVPALISRTGYTGEDGFELFVPAEHAVEVWRAVLGAGKAEGVLPSGLGARDACRLEAGLRLYGNDMDETTNPFDAGLGWTVKLGKGTFLGSEALATIKAAGARRRMVGLKTTDKTIPRHDSAVLRAGEAIGRVTSGTWSFFLNQGVAMASLEAGKGAPGDSVEVEVRGRPGKAEVVALPIYRGSVKSPTASKN